MLLIALNAVLNLLVLVLTNPLVLLLVIGTAVLFGLSKFPKLAWAVVAWAYWCGVLGQVLNDFKDDPIGLAALGFLTSLNLTFGLIGVGVYFALKKLKLKVG